MPAKSLSAMRESVGETNETVTDLRVERSKVAEFAAAVQADDAMYVDADAAAAAGHDAVPAPPTFARTSYFPHNRPAGVGAEFGFDLGFDPARVVHGEQEYEYERPLYVGDVLTGETTLLDVYQRESDRAGTMTFAVFETVYYDADGDPVLTARNTRIETGGAIDAEDGTADAEAADD